VKQLSSLPTNPLSLRHLPSPSGISPTLRHLPHPLASPLSLWERVRVRARARARVWEKE